MSTMFIHLAGSLRKALVCSSTGISERKSSQPQVVKAPDQSAANECAWLLPVHHARVQRWPARERIPS